MNSSRNYTNFIQEEIENNKIVLFMKGSKDMPACGFSAIVVRILDTLNVQFKYHDVLADPLLREEIKKFSDWPTIPQLYVKGHFVGGADIIAEMYKSQELEKIVNN